MAASSREEASPVDGRWWDDVAGPVVGPGGMYYAGLSMVEGAWHLEHRAGPEHAAEVHTLPDRLAVEQQLARALRGLPIQDRLLIERQREVVIEPEEETERRRDEEAE
jgi:hypothetical protein